MSLSRRSFLGWSMGFAAGAVATRLFGRVPSARAAEPYGGPLFFGIHAGGGWDPIFLTDPKPSVELNRVTQTVGQAGNIRFADHAVDPVAFGYDAQYAAAYSERLFSNRMFFEKHGARTTVFNGVDTRTNNHDTGTRYVWSGKSEIGHPALGALVAAQAGNIQDGHHEGPPLAFLSAGGYDHPGGLVPLSRASSSGAMRRLMFPNQMNADEPEGDDRYHATFAEAAIKRARQARIDAQMGKATLPTMKQALVELAGARASMGDLKTLDIPPLVDLPGNNLDDVQSLMQTTQVALAAMKAGLTLATSMSYGGFDTHGNHDRDMVVRLSKLLGAVDFVISEAERQGLSERLVIMVGSDFGRGPYYNGTGNNSGKDHWSATTCLVIVPPSRASQFGNRVIGGTNDEVRARKVAPGGLGLDDQGVSLTPLSIHQGLRKLLAVEGSEGAGRYPLATDQLALFG